MRRISLNLTIGGEILIFDDITVATMDEMLSLDPVTPVGTRVRVTATGLTYELQQGTDEIAGLSVKGAGALALNGSLNKRGESGGASYYNYIGSPDNNGVSSVVYSAPRWLIFDGDTAIAYQSSSDYAAFPFNAAEWFLVDSGTAPTPTVTRNGVASLANWIAQ